ncbi:unnamed protein product [Amoebophrya sp. A120]|nr:unnamed protein product [Amoebophrya sp. A120]|eukprot:GSA120T00004634001.1
MVLYKTKEILIDGKIVYEVPEHLELIKKVGSGAYGCVASFMDNNRKEKVAIKKITNAFADLIDGKRILREIKLLSHFKHDNIIQILDIFPPKSREFDDIYIVTDLMETDLHRVIYSKQALTEEHAQYFIYQVLRGLYYLQSCNVVHRDLKPSNLLVNKNCDLKICDFGLARGMSEDEDDPGLTDYVVTRWYRAPEVVLAASAYSEKIDVWSVGCILYEILARKPLFTGKDHLDQIRKIIEKVGTPGDNDLKWIPEKGPSRKFLAKCPISNGIAMKDLLPNGIQDATVDFLTKLLTFDPTKRISIKVCILVTSFSVCITLDDLMWGMRDWYTYNQCHAKIAFEIQIPPSSKNRYGLQKCLGLESWNL